MSCQIERLIDVDGNRDRPDMHAPAAPRSDLTNQPETVPLSELWTREWPQSVEEFEAFVGIFQARLFQLAFYRLCDHQEAEDVVQMVFVKAFTERVRLRKAAKRTAAYLFRMTVNACIDRIRVRGRRNEIPIHDLTHELPQPERGYREAAEEAQRIQNLLRRLPGEQANVICYRIFDELSFMEIAEIEGSLETTIRSRYRYGIQKLRAVLHEEG